MAAAAPVNFPEIKRASSDCGSVRDNIVALRLDNFPHISSAFGAGAAQACLDALENEIAQLPLQELRPDTAVPGGFVLSFGRMTRPEVAGLLEAVLAGFSLKPVAFGNERIHPAMSWLHCESGESGTAWMPHNGAPAGRGELWAEFYREDMAEIARALAALRGGGLSMAWQAVRDAAEPSRTLYHEALTRLGGTESGISAARLFPALERLGLSRPFDHFVMATILDELENAPDAVIGVNLSGCSAALDGWWASLFERLRDAPALAARLVVEITETAQLAADAGAFAAALRGLGVRVALDDFGMGFASIRNAIRLDPDIVKIDAFFTCKQEFSLDFNDMLRHLTGIAATVAPIVVVEGVETPEHSNLVRCVQAELAPQSRGCWQQGYLFDRPSSDRPWRRHGD